MRVGIFTDTYRPQVNGVVSSISTLERELRKKGHKVYIVTTTDPDAPEVEPNVLRIPSMEFKPLPQYRLGLLYSPKIIKKINKLNLDIIHSQTEWGVGTFARFAAVNLEIPLVHTYHTLYEYYTHYITKGHFTVPAKKIAAGISKFYCEKCDALIVPTRKVEDILYSYDVDKVMNIIPTGLDLDRFYRENYTDEEINFMRESFGVEDDEFLCVYIGRIAQEKSIDVLIDMFSKIEEIIRAYNLEECTTKEEIYNMENHKILEILEKRLGVSKNDEHNYEVISRRILKDYRIGKIGKFFLEFPEIE